MLCTIEEFKNALTKSIALFDDKVIESKNLLPKEIEPITRNVKLFLTTLKLKIESNNINTYEKLISFLENIELSNRDLIPLTGYLGKILDVIQLLKPNTTRSKNAKKYFKNSLKRTGHDFLYNELSEGQKDRLFDEIINSSALYILLEISNFAYSNSINPISTLRNSMGDRLPEEYFSELLAGWFIEDVLIEKLRSKGFNINQTGIDTNRKILFKRPRNMGDADINIKYNTHKYSIELQRVGKATKPNKINGTRNTDIIKTSLKSHKITDNNALTLLWFGNNPKGIATTNSFLHNKLCIVKNSDVNNKENSNIFFQNENIFIHKDYIEDNSFISWKELKNSSIDIIASKFNMVSKKKIPNKKFKVLDLFAGVGGLSYGFAHDENFEIVAANELLPDMAKAYSLNHPSVKMYNCDIKDFGLKNLTEDLQIKKGDIDLIIGGPPCQAFSTVGKRLIDDPRGKLFQEYYRVLEELNPKLFLFENVKGLLSMQKGELLKTILSLFESLGYKVKYEVLNSADYGVPQIRERVIIIGTKLNQDFKYPKPTHSSIDDNNIFNQDLKPYLTLSEAISDLPFIKNNKESFEYSTKPNNEFQKLMRINAPEKLMDHNAPKNNTKLVQLMECLPDGGTPQDAPEELRPKSGFKNTYCRLWWERPAPTITRNLSTPSSSRCIHPKAPRPLTTREGARIQCFPDNYIFYGSRSSKNLQIGNAVPTFLSVALKYSIKQHLLVPKFNL